MNERQQVGAGTSERARRKSRVGTVVSDRMQKSVVVSFERRITHELYGKQATRTKKVVAHDEENAAKVGDVVRIMETRPLSKTKRWRVVAIVERAK
ncbi:MAG: 30S ribosomal protein S17 [Gemmatimonadetes bacterium GWC2_71_10]|nr:MAG: 30S ribosomal protein S17 [Gemmatimonadetes bacterium GWC2_71_10]